MTDFSCAYAHRSTSRERDSETGFEDGNDYFFARYYGSQTGRFLSPDWSAQEEPVPYAKLDDPQTLNLYGYLRNNPLGGIDADGHCGSGPNDPPCNQVKVAVKVEQKPKFTKNVPLKDKDGNVVKGPNGKPVEKDTGIHGTLAGTVTVNGTPAAGVKLTESNAVATVIDGTNTNPHVREGEGTSPNGQYNDDIGYGFATSGKADNANIINQLSTEKLTITDTQTLTMTFPSGGTCSATSTRVLTNVGADGNASSHYTLTTTQPVVTPPNN
jgi:RHS repeat-associated protein